MARGGVRPNSGRKSKAEEQKTQAICRNALQAMYGGDESVIEAMMQTGEPSLMKFILEHAYGKPVDKVAQTDADGKYIPDQPAITIQVVSSVPDITEQ